MQQNTGLFTVIYLLLVTLEQIRDFIARSRWVFAKTMPTTPHEYTLRRQTHDSMLFDAFILHVRRVGVQREFGRATYIYLDVDEHEYWTMGAPVEKTILINRAIRRSQ